MKQDLLKPPALKPRGVAILSAVAGSLILIGGLVLWLLGLVSLGELGTRLLVAAAIWGATVWMYLYLIRVGPTTRPERMPYVHAALGTVGVVAVNLIFMAMLHGSSFAGGMSYLWIIPGAAGMTLAMGGWARRVGESLHCPNCEYEFNFADADAPDRCPECAALWLGKLNRGRRFKSPRIIALGISLAVVGIVLLQPMLWVWPLAKILPTPILYGALYMEPKSVYSAWEELAARPLGKGWIETMGKRVLAHRERHQWDISGSIWFEAMEKSARMPANLVERYYAEGFVANCEVPKRAKAGEPFTVRFLVRRAAEGFGAKLGIMFGGYSIDGENVVGREEEAVWGYQLRPGPLSRQRDAFAQNLQITSPGKHKIAATYWIVYQPSFWKISWRLDGTAQQPTTAMWFKRVDVEHEIEIE